MLPQYLRLRWGRRFGGGLEGIVYVSGESPEFRGILRIKRALRDPSEFEGIHQEF